MMKIRTSSLLLGLGLALLLTGFVVGSAAAGWKLKFSTTPAYLAFAGSGLSFIYASIYLLRRDARAAKQREEQFLNDLKVVADDLTMSDAEDSLEDLPLLYDEEQRKDILARLARMPKGRRQLRVVLVQMERDGV